MRYRTMIIGCLLIWLTSYLYNKQQWKEYERNVRDLPGISSFLINYRYPKAADMVKVEELVRSFKY